MASDHRGKPLHAGKRTADEQYQQMTFAPPKWSDAPGRVWDANGDLIWGHPDDTPSPNNPPPAQARPQDLFSLHD
jgi:hypothetical protein